MNDSPQLFFKIIMIWLLIIVRPHGDELQLLQRAEELNFGDQTRIDCRVDPEGGFWVLMDEVWEGNVPLYRVRRYTAASPPVTYEVGTSEGLAHGYIYPRFCGFTEGQLYVSNQHLSDIYPECARLLVIDYQQQTSTSYFTPPLSSQYIGRIWPGEGSRAAAYYFDDSPEGRLCFLHRFSLYSDYPGVIAVDFDGDTLWTLAGVDSRFQDQRLPGTDLYGCGYAYADSSGMGFTGFNGSDTLVIDTMVTDQAVHRAAWQATDSLFTCMWNLAGTAELYLWQYNPFSDQIVRDTLFYESSYNSWELVGRFRMATQGDSVCIQYPVLRNSSSEHPGNWRALVRKLFVPGVPADVDTIIFFEDILQGVWHAVDMDAHGIHSGIATYHTNGIAKIYYYGALDVIAGIEPHPQRTAEIFTLLRTYPNPFNATLRVEFECGSSETVRLTLYDLNGRIRFQDELVARPGLNRYSWSGRDHLGRAVGAGVYLLELSAQNQKRVQKVTLLK